MAIHKGARPLRVVALGGGMNGNTAACCRAFHDLGNHLLIVTSGTSAHTSFEPLRGLDRGEIVSWDVHEEARVLVDRVGDFRPDAIMCAGWDIPSSYREVMRRQRPEVLRMLFMDSIWRASPKQWMGRALHRIAIDPLFDVAVVPSDRTEFLARRIGFGPADIIRGMYTADTPLFDRGPRSIQEIGSRRRFIYVGRLIPFKGIEVLAAAYSRYRSQAADPWELDVVGAGPEQRHLTGIEGVTTHGFLQPPQVAALMHESSCLLLPSVNEHWGIVIHEAAAAGLALLVSESAGAVPGLLQDGFNGWSVPTADVAAWSFAMDRMASQPVERLGEMSAISRALSTRLSPSGWARHMYEEIERRLPA